MKRSHVILLVLAHLALVVGVVTWVATQAAEEEGVELGGMVLDDEELRELSKDTMGEADLADVDLVTPKDANPDLEGTIVDGVRTFELTARPSRWEYREGQDVATWSYQGQVPGPTLHATEGERVRVTVKNELPEATTVHWHGVDVPNAEDGVPGVTQEAIEPGDTYTYEFTATPSGTRWYHTHGARMGEETAPLDMGLSGAFVITPRRAGAGADVDQVLVLDEWNVGEDGLNAAMLGGHASHGGESNLFTINGRAHPDVRELEVRRGDRVRLRFVNASSRSYHPMHLHGHQFRIVALDGNPVEHPITRNVVLLAPGETADVEFLANNPGTWLLHCHDTHHADAGMGMEIRYEGSKPAVKPAAKRPAGAGEQHGGGGHAH